MNIFVTGGTGLIGRALILRLRRDGHTVRALVRSASRARHAFGTEAIPIIGSSQPALRSGIEGADAIVNLAGEPVLARRWSGTVKESLISSRVGLAYAIRDAVAACRVKPRVLVNASAVGYYGDRGDERVDERSSSGTGFLAELCRDWEAAANSIGTLGLRVAIMRVAVVLARSSGALAQMLPPFRAGLGGPVGSGRQYFPWIHLEDVVEAIACAISDERYAGPINAVAPQEVTNREFSKALGHTLKKPAVMPVPAPVLKLVFGDAAQAILGGQRVVPKRLTELGFKWKFGTLESALANVVRDEGRELSLVHAGEGPRPHDEPGSDYLLTHPPAYLLRARAMYPAPRTRVFEFFSRPENLGWAFPPSIKLTPLALSGPMAKGVNVDYTLQVGPPIVRNIKMKWRTHFEAYAACGG